MNKETALEILNKMLEKQTNSVLIHERAIAYFSEKELVKFEKGANRSHRRHSNKKKALEYAIKIIKEK